MAEFFTRLFSSDFMPHGHCYGWRPEILWLHVVSDVVIALSYFTIPIALLIFMRRRSYLSFNSVFYLFSAFILFCGLTHLIEIYNVWNGAYRIEGVVKGATALASIGTALVLWPMLPRAFPMLEEMQGMNDVLQREIEARRAAEEELRALTGRLEETVAERTRDLEMRSQMLDQSNDAVIAWDEAGRLSYWNRGAERLYGYSAEEALDLAADAGPGRLLDARYPGPWSEIEQRVADEGEWSGDVEQTARDGESITVATRLQRIEDAAGTHLLEVNRDISERKRAEGILERSNRELEQFAAAASHDLQEPVRRVISFMQLLREKYGEELDADGQEYIELAIEGGHRMHSLIRDLLEYSTYGRGAEAANVELVDAVDHARRSLSGEIERRGATLSHGALPAVRAPRAGLVRVLEHLIANALQYTERAPEVRIEAVREGDRVRVSVTDNGIGIEPQHHGRIFEIFRRLHLRREHPGNGIGLAIVQRVVEDWGGSVTVESTPGQGSSFAFTVPAA